MHIYLSLALSLVLGLVASRTKFGCGEDEDRETIGWTMALGTMFLAPLSWGLALVSPFGSWLTFAIWVFLIGLCSRANAESRSFFDRHFSDVLARTLGGWLGIELGALLCAAVLATWYSGTSDSQYFRALVSSDSPYGPPFWSLFLGAPAAFYAAILGKALPPIKWSLRSYGDQEPALPVVSEEKWLLDPPVSVVPVPVVVPRERTG